MYKYFNGVLLLLMTPLQLLHRANLFQIVSEINQKIIQLGSITERQHRHLITEDSEAKKTIT